MTKITSRPALDFSDRETTTTPVFYSDQVEMTADQATWWNNRLDVLSNTRPPYGNYIATEDAFDPGYLTEEEFTGKKAEVDDLLARTAAVIQNIFTTDRELSKLAAAKAAYEKKHFKERTITVSEAIEVLTALQGCTHPDALIFVKDQGIDVSDFLAKP